MEKSMYKIDFQLDSGFYLAGDTGGDGKTFLANLMAERSVYDRDYASILYEKGKATVYGDLDKAKYIFADKFIRYKSDRLVNKLLALSKKSIVMIDFKPSREGELLYGVCTVYMANKSTIEITGVGYEVNI